MSIRFREVQDRYLYEIYRRVMTSRDDFVIEEGFNPLLNIGVSSLLAKKAIEGLVNRDYMKYREDLSTLSGRYFEITAEGIEYVEAENDRYESVIARLDRGQENEPNVLAPASDRVVSLDHNSAPYKEAIAAVDQVIEGLRLSPNDIGSITAEDRAIVLSNLEHGRKLLTAPQISLSAVAIFLKASLTFIAGAAASGAIGDLSVRALNLLSTLFGVG